MTNRHRTITALLAVIAVLLAANLAANHERPVQAADTERGVGPYVVQVSTTATTTGTLAESTQVYRLWSDGAMDMWALGARAYPYEII